MTAFALLVCFPFGTSDYYLRFIILCVAVVA
jgi:hypothetical protein